MSCLLKCPSQSYHPGSFSAGTSLGGMVLHNQRTPRRLGYLWEEVRRKRTLKNAFEKEAKANSNLSQASFVGVKAQAVVYSNINLKQLKVRIIVLGSQKMRILTFLLVFHYIFLHEST